MIEFLEEQGRDCVKYKGADYDEDYQGVVVEI